MKAAWLTDIHLNFLSREKWVDFYQTINQENVDAVFLSGDVAEAKSIRLVLESMAQTLGKPIYFILGNHDYYGSSIEYVRNSVVRLTQTNTNLKWIQSLGPINLINDTLLVGVDGFADGRYGNYLESQMELNDSILIHEFLKAKNQSRSHLLTQMQKYADEDAQKLHQYIENGIVQFQPKKIIIITHVPPFPETCMYLGAQSDEYALPFFSSKATGDVIINAAEQHQHIEFIVLCGHTHHFAQIRKLPNLLIKVGDSEYSEPKIQEIIEI